MERLTEAQLDSLMEQYPELTIGELKRKKYPNYTLQKVDKRLKEATGNRVRRTIAKVTGKR
jgi:hypothetical protein